MELFKKSSSLFSKDPFYSKYTFYDKKESLADDDDDYLGEEDVFDLFH